MSMKLGCLKMKLKKYRKENNKNKNNIKPILYINNPINDLNQDIVGFETQIASIEQAIDSGATMIGLIADYGTGKSSVTDILCQKKSKSKKSKETPIKINMWDTIESVSGSEQSVNDLTKTFLFQLANGSSSQLGSYVNKRLSKNYRLLSFGVHSIWAWITFAVSLVLFGLSKISEIEHIYKPAFISELPQWLIDIVKVIFDISPLLLVGAIILATIGISLSSIAFSHWKTEKSSEKEINDIFDTYQYIVNKIKPKKGKKRIIIIEDVDRVDDKKLVQDFLKEIYRFQNLLKKYKNRFVFIVSIKPEASLELDSGKEETTNIYSKIFDISISLKPIHYDDYDSLLTQMISIDPNKKAHIESLIGVNNIDKELPKSFDWIKEGTNLTIRDLKDRLNTALEIMVSLKNKDHQGNSSAKFEVCAAVSFLEHQYPEDYAELIKQEISLSNFISDSYVLKKRNNYELKDIEKSFYDNFIKEYEFNQNFIDYLIKLVKEGYLDEDYRMYLYSYPKGSHIKTVNEKYLCNLLQLPYNKIEKEKLDVAVENVFKTENNVVTNIMQNIPSYPDAILLNDTFLYNAVKINCKKVANTIKTYVIDNDSADDKYALDILKRVYSLEDRDSLIKQIVRVASIYLVEEFPVLLRFRKRLIKTFGSEILLFKELYDNINTITEEEIDLLNDSIVAIKLISIELIEESNCNYIVELVSSVRSVDEKNVFEKTKKILDKSLDFLLEKDIAQYLLDYMINNEYISEPYFEIVANCIDDTVNKSDVALLLNTVSITFIEYPTIIKIVDEIGFEKDLSLDIVQQLTTNGYFYTPLLYYSNLDRLSKINFENFSENILDALKSIFDYSKNVFLKVRKHIVNLCLIKTYKELFFQNYDFITIEEYNQIEDGILAINCIDTAAINEDTVGYICELINSKKHCKEEIIYLFKYLFNPNCNTNCVNDDDLINKLISNLDFSNSINFNLLSKEECEEAIENFSNSIELEIAENAYKFMRRVNCLIPSLEITVQNEPAYENLYIELINQTNQFTEQTYKWVKQRTPDSKLPYCLCEELLKDGDYYQYIPAISLLNNELVIDESIDFDHYFDVYTDIDEMFDFMNKNKWFLEKLRDNSDFGMLNRLDVEKLHPIYNVEQTENIFNFVFKYLDETEQKYYLNHYRRFKTEKDSKKFQLLICSDENIELVDSWDLYYKIKTSLWESNPTHKQQFTRIWNIRWKEELSA